MADVTTHARGRARLDEVLARTRVPLGFVFGAVVLWLAQPTFRSLAIGGVVAAAGEVLRVWAAGHLEKGREITRSGPYRLTRHPLYTGSALIGAGVAIASARWIVAGLVAAYLVPTIVSAIRHEEANMRAAFGGGPDSAESYDAYVASRATPVDRAFSMERALRNKEYRAIAGLAVMAAVFAFKVIWRVR
ncbi:MAG TPA: methyltransferase [Vicinamibacterales bacterium]|nr:methyltransferase [Vicinamibacterales bacterium]